MSGYLSALVCHIITLPYPIFASFKAIESSDKNDDTQWLTFWVVFASVMMTESMTNLFMHWIPFYFEIKVLFFLLLQLPYLNLSEKLYQLYIKPYLIQRQITIDNTITRTVQSIFQNIPFSIFQYKKD